MYRDRFNVNGYLEQNVLNRVMGEIQSGRSETCVALFSFLQNELLAKKTTVEYGKIPT